MNPYLKNQITQEIALERSMVPIREYMIKYTKEKEIALFIKMAKMEKPKKPIKSTFFGCLKGVQKSVHFGTTGGFIFKK